MPGSRQQYNRKPAQCSLGRFYPSIPGPIEGIGRAGDRCQDRELEPPTEEQIAPAARRYLLTLPVLPVADTGSLRGELIAFGRLNGR